MKNRFREFWLSLNSLLTSLGCEEAMLCEARRAWLKGRVKSKFHSYSGWIV